MNDLIRRDDVIKAIHGYWSSKINELPTELTEDGEVIADMQKANEYLAHNKQISLFVKLIEAAEPKRGRWIIDRKFGADIMSDEQMVICSECKQGIFWGRQNYCPNCGAKMSNASNASNALETLEKGETE